MGEAVPADLFLLGAAKVFEIHCQSSFSRRYIKGLMQSIAVCSASENVNVTMAGRQPSSLLEEVVEEALDVCQAWGESPLPHPWHLRVAFHSLNLIGKIPSTKHRKVLFF